MIRNHAESNNILLTRNRTYPLVIPLHCLWAKSSNRTPGQFDCAMTGFVFGECGEGGGFT